MSKPTRTRHVSIHERTVNVARYPYESASNPYQTLLYGALGREGVILQPDRPFTASALVRMRPRILLAQGRLRLARLLGYRIAWTIHDLPSREQPGSREPMADALARRADVLFCHDDTLAERAALELGIDRARIDVVPHGPLSTAYPAPRSTRDETVFLAFGTLRRYKEIDLVLDGFRKVTDPGARLVVAGDPAAAGIEEVIRRDAAADPRVVVQARHVQDAEVRELFEACDIGVPGIRSPGRRGSGRLDFRPGRRRRRARVGTRSCACDARSGTGGGRSMCGHSERWSHLGGRGHPRCAPPPRQHRGSTAPSVRARCR